MQFQKWPYANTDNGSNSMLLDQNGTACASIGQSLIGNALLSSSIYLTRLRQSRPPNSPDHLRKARVAERSVPQWISQSLQLSTNTSDAEYGHSRKIQAPVSIQRNTNIQFAPQVMLGQMWQTRGRRISINHQEKYSPSEQLGPPDYKLDRRPNIRVLVSYCGPKMRSSSLGIDLEWRQNGNRQSLRSLSLTAA